MCQNQLLTIPQLHRYRRPVACGDWIFSSSRGFAFVSFGGMQILSREESICIFPMEQCHIPPYTFMEVSSRIHFNPPELLEGLHGATFPNIFLYDPFTVYTVLIYKFIIPLPDIFPQDKIMWFFSSLLINKILHSSLWTRTELYILDETALMFWKAVISCLCLAMSQLQFLRGLA